VRHLLELGHRRIAYLSSELVELSTDHARLDGYTRALSRYRVRRDPELIVRLGRPAHLRSDDGLRAAISGLLRLPHPASAIFASNDLLAVDVLETVEELGLRVPDHVSVVGFDDIRVAGLTRIRLTTIAQPRDELARIGIEFLLARIEDATGPPRHRLLEPSLVVRGSTAPPPLEGERHVSNRLPGA
jgi:DNA-binding LacI/PurR family transcriptional regulator